MRKLPPRPDQQESPPATAEAAQRLRRQLAVEAAGIGSFDWDLVTGRLDWDDRLLDMFGYSREEWGERIEAFAARLHPDDAAELGVEEGDVVEIASACGAIEAPARLTDEVVRGVVAVPHGWPGRRNVNLLASAAPEDLEPLAGMPLLNGIPVRVTAAAGR